jgi:hypothetical protein
MKKRARINYDHPDFAELRLDNEDYEMRKHWALVYANVELSTKDMKDEVIKYDNYPGFVSLEPWRFITAGKYAWLLNNEAELMPDTKEFFERHMAELRSLADEVVEEREEVKTTNKVNEVYDLVADIDVALDQFLKKEIKTFDVTELLNKQQPKKYTVESIRDDYKKLFDELSLYETDSTIKEIYRLMSERMFKSYRSLIEKIIDDMSDWLQDNKRVIHRRKRRKKIKTPEELVKTTQFQERDDDLGLVSFHPVKIIGATFLLTYNTRYKKLAYFKSNEGGFSMKGCTLQNFDESASVEKIIRKPEEVLSEAINWTRLNAQRSLKNLKTKEYVPTGRLNMNTIVLKVV